MSNIKELMSSIISGKEYNEVFKAVMLDKIGQRLQTEKVRIAQSMFEQKSCDCDCSEKSSSGKCSICDMPIRKAKDPKGTPEEKWKKQGIF